MAQGVTSVVLRQQVVGYIRVSKDEQAKSGLGLEAQRQKLKAYAMLYELDLVKVFVEPGASAKTLKGRPALSAALGMLKAGTAKGFLVAKLDRLTRSMRDLGYLLDNWFNDKGYSLLSVAENIDTRSAAGRLVVNVLGSVAQWERETISERTKDALAVKKARGERTGSVPYGKLEGKGGKLLPNPKEMSIVDEVTRLGAQGWSVRLIEDRMRALDIRGRKGRLIGKSQIHRILTKDGRNNVQNVKTEKAP